MTKFLMAAAFAALIPLQSPAADKPTKPNMAAKKLLGEYRMTGGAKYGEPIPAERLRDNMVIITPKTIAVVDRDKNNLYSSSYVLSPGEEEGVWNIDLTSEIPKPGEKALGLLKTKGKQVWLIYSLTAERPTDFETGDKELMFKMVKGAKAADLDGAEAPKTKKKPTE